jgi:hypothetical protein
MNPYMSFLLEQFVEALKAFHVGGLDNQTYWMGIIQTVTKSFMFDDGGMLRKALPTIKLTPFHSLLARR